MSSPTQRSLLDAWRQGWPVPGAIGSYAVLAALTVSATSAQWGSVRVNLTLCALAAAWMLLPLHPGLRKRTPVMAVFVTGLIVITAILVIRDPWFGFFTPIGYGLSFRLLPWPWLLPPAAAMAVLAATAQAHSVDKHTLPGLVAYGAMIALNVLLICSLFWLLHGVEKQHDQRKQALDELSEANRRLEATLAENEGLHRQLLVQAREAGILEERRRMAQEIHDTLAQGLTGIVTQLQAAEQAAGDPVRWRRHFTAATRLARENLAEARRSVHALRPEPLETARLSEALAGVAGRWSALNGIPVQVRTTGTERPIQPQTEFALLRAAQEALANVAKHAQATRVGLTVSYMDNEVALDVRDDGVGFDPALLGDRGQASAGPDGTSGGNGHGMPPDGDGCGFGLIAMRQRIRAVSGTLHIESEPGGGTAISACVPAGSAQDGP